MTAPSGVAHAAYVPSRPIGGIERPKVSSRASPALTERTGMAARTASASESVTGSARWASSSQRGGLRYSKRSDAGPTQRGEMTAHAEPGAQVPGQRPDIRTRRALDDHVDVEQIARDRADRGQLEPRHLHRPGGEHHVLAGPDSGVRPFPHDLDRRHRPMAPAPVHR